MIDFTDATQALLRYELCEPRVLPAAGRPARLLLGLSLALAAACRLRV